MVTSITNSSIGSNAPSAQKWLRQYISHQARRIRFFSFDLSLIWESHSYSPADFPIYRNAAGEPLVIPQEKVERNAWPVFRVAHGDSLAERAYWVEMDDGQSQCFRVKAWLMTDGEEQVIAEETEKIDKRFCPEARVRQLDEELSALLCKVADQLANRSDSNGLRLRLSNPNLQPCRQIRNCELDDCPAHHDDESLRCWEIENTHCNENIRGLDPIEKFHYCNRCQVFLMACPDPLTRVGENLNRLLNLLQLKYQESLQAQARIQQSEKMATVGEIVLSLTHEIKTPLSVIMSRLDCLRLELDQLNPEELSEDLEVLASHAGRMRRLLEEMLKLASPQVAEFETLNLNELIEGTANLVEKTLSRDSIAMDFKPGKKLPAVRGDFHQLQQVLLNLILNARDAMTEGGLLSIQTRYLPETSQVELQVSDDGPGIEADLIERIFMPFFTTKHAQGGTGLGLSLCRRIMMMHGGKIDVESKPGKGCCFTLLFPIARGK